MGLGDPNLAKSKFLTIRKGKIVRRTEGTEEEFPNVTGNIMNIMTDPDGKYGCELHIYLRCFKQKENYVLHMLLNSAYASAFLKSVKNIILSDPVTFTPTFKVVDGKNNSGMFFNQDGVAAKWYYTKANPNGLPDAVWGKVVKYDAQGNKTTEDGWNFDNQLSFLLKMVEVEIFPQLPGTETEEQNESATQESNAGSDDLPF